MSLYCFHASHEQFAPSRLVNLAIQAEKAGFDAIHSSDHFHPWSRHQGQSGFAFSLLGAAMQATKLPFSVVCAPGQRYHPAIVAQAAATLAEMFPARFDIELGSGEAINEMITGEGWPDKATRNQRLLESADVIRRLLNGEEVTHKGEVVINKARLYVRPSIPPLLYCAAVSKETCEWAAGWADGLITTGGDEKSTAEKIEAFKRNGGNGKPFNIQVSFSYAETMEDALQGAYEQWRTNILPREKLADLSTVAEFDRLANNTSREDVAASIECFTTIPDLIRWTEPYRQMGAGKIILHNVHPNQEYFIEAFGQYKEAYVQTEQLSL